MKWNDVILNEEYSEEVPGYQDIGNDKSTEYSLRQTRLTLKQINKLRKMNDIRRFEKEADLVNVRAQYGAPAGEEGGGEDIF